MGDAGRDNNRVTTILALSNADGVTPVAVYADPTTHRLLVSVSGQNVQGTDIASANDLDLGSNDNDTFEVTGAVQINAILTEGRVNGFTLKLLFASTPTVKHNTAGGAGTAVIITKTGADVTVSAGDTMQLVLSEIGGTQAWREL